MHGEFFGDSLVKMNGGVRIANPASRLVKAGKRNTCAVLDEKLFVKLFSRLDDGKNPDIELQQKMESNARIAIIPLQDILSLGEHARINDPAKLDGNWRWRWNPVNDPANSAFTRILELGKTSGSNARRI